MIVFFSYTQTSSLIPESIIYPMFNEGFIDKFLRTVKKIIPTPIFNFLAPVYHLLLSMLGALAYGFPSRSLKIIGVTGTKGKSTTVYMITRILENAGEKVAAIGSLGYKILDKEWPNTLKMTMPGRTRLQKFLWQAKKAGAEFVVLEVTSEGLAQHRLAGVAVDGAVFTNLHREHLESHGGFDNYLRAKQKLFEKTKHIHILNHDDPYFEKFSDFPASIKITYGQHGLINPARYHLNLKLLGDFNIYNALAALSVADTYRLDMNKAVQTLNSIDSIPGRMEVIEAEFKGLKFKVIIDYAHTPDSLEAVYGTFKEAKGTEHGTGSQEQRVVNSNPRALSPKLICVLGAAGGGRDKWKRPEFGRIAGQYCDEIILTNEDPYDEDPEEILNQVEKGIGDKFKSLKVSRILDRGEAIKVALTDASANDIVVITGKGSETSIAVGGGRNVSWSDRQAVLNILRG